MSVLLGSSGGTFSAATSYPTGLVPKAVAVGDFNGDGKRDLVTANTAGNYPSGGPNPGGDQVSVLHGNGSGGFGAPTNYQTGNTPFAVVVGQLNADSSPDLVTANWFSNDVSVLLNTTTGLPPPGGTTYLSDMTFTQATNGWGPVERDTSNGEAAAGDGVAIRLNGTTYTKGLGVHALSDVRMTLPANCTRFKGSVGLDDEVGSLGSVTFEVYADATKIYDSGVMNGATATKAVDVAIPAGAVQLRLNVTNGGDGIAYDHADWADARIECGAGGGDTTPPTITNRTPAPGASGVAVTVSPTATFSEAMDPATLTTSTFTLVAAGPVDPARSLRQLREPGRHPRPERRSAAEHDLHRHRQGWRLGRQGPRRQPARRRRHLELLDGGHEPAARARDRLADVVADVEGRRRRSRSPGRPRIPSRALSRRPRSRGRCCSSTAPRTATRTRSRAGRESRAARSPPRITSTRRTSSCSSPRPTAAERAGRRPCASIRRP